MSIHFSKPRLVKSSHGWYITFDFEGKRVRIKKGINRVKDLKEREYHAKVLIEVLLEKLQNGWNPNTNTYQESLFIKDALDFALHEKSKRVSKKTYSGYKSTINFIKNAVDVLGYDYLSTKTIKRKHIRLLMDQAKEKRDWSNKAYNKNLNYLSAVMDELLHTDYLEINPCTKIRRLPEEQSIANRVPTTEEHSKIKSELSLNHPFFCSFIETLYHTGVRPKELLSIQLFMVDLENRQINLRPLVVNQKNKNRSVVINNHLYELLHAMELHTYPQNYYLFGSYRVKGRGNNGKKLDFIPGPTQLKRDTSTKRWKRIIKDGLGIDVNMYAYKHFGADMKLISGVDLDSIRNQLGHSTKKMTTTYAREIKGIYKRDIIDNSPKF